MKENQSLTFEENQISSVMLKDHGNLHKLLGEFKRTLGNDKHSPLLAFNKLKWQMEKHFFIEEKTILTSDITKDVELNKKINHLIKEHNLMLNMMDDIKKDLNIKYTTEQAKLDHLQETLVRHSYYEDNILYPALEDNINELDQKIIIERIKSLYK